MELALGRAIRWAGSGGTVDSEIMVVITLVVLLIMRRKSGSWGRKEMAAVSEEE